MTNLIFQSAKPWTIVRFSGSSLTDGHHIEQLNVELTERIGKLPMRAMLLINFRGIEFVSSQVIGMLLNAKARIEGKSGTLILCRVSPKLREALEITGLIKQFKIEESETAVIGDRPTRRAPARATEVGWLD